VTNSAASNAGVVASALSTSRSASTFQDCGIYSWDGAAANATLWTTLSSRDGSDTCWVQPTPDNSGVLVSGSFGEGAASLGGTPLASLGSYDAFAGVLPWGQAALSSLVIVRPAALLALFLCLRLCLCLSLCVSVCVSLSHTHTRSPHRPNARLLAWQHLQPPGC
jgi:hypothetical protein